MTLTGFNFMNNDAPDIGALLFYQIELSLSAFWNV